MRIKHAGIALRIGALVTVLGLAAGGVATAQSIQITNPLEGEVWPNGVEQTISWTASGLDPSAEIYIWYLELGAATDWILIAGLSRDETSYTWTVPPQPLAHGWLYVGSWAGDRYETDDVKGFTIRNRSVPDFGADGRSDILWRHSGGALYIWEMDGTTTPASLFMPPISTNWLIAGLGDIGGNGATDILWRESASGSTYIWNVLTTTVPAVSGYYTDSQADNSWAIEGLGDFGGDGRGDIVWRHTGGALYLWEMIGTTTPASSYLPPISTNWQIEALGDFDGDWKSDILWRETNSGNTYVWFMDGPIATGTGYTDSQADNSWTIEGTGDFDGDGQSDILWRHTSGALYIWQMNGTMITTSSFLPSISTAWQIQQLADYNGDGRTDILWRETASGSTYIWLMNGPTAMGSDYTQNQADNSWVIQDP